MRINTTWAVRPVPTEPEWSSPEPDRSENSVPEALRHWPLCHQSWPDIVLCGQRIEGHIRSRARKEEHYLYFSHVALTQFFSFSEHHPSHLQNEDPCDTAQELSTLGSGRPGFESQPSCLLATYLGQGLLISKSVSLLVRLKQLMVYRLQNCHED